jgi:predicted amidohydrolase
MRVELAACQVHIDAADYASEETFEALLERVGAELDRARAPAQPGSSRLPCLAVFPEMIGAFLPLVERGRAVKDARTIDSAMARVAALELPQLVRSMWRGRTLSPTRALLLGSAARVWRIYRRAFSRFARRHACWVVAGSALLPRNAYGELASEFAPASGQVYNTSYVFDPSGEQVGAIRKVNLVPTLEDRLGLTPGEPRELSPVETPFGRLGVLICYDGFLFPHTAHEPSFTPLLTRYDDRGCVVVAQPSANPWPWNERWFFCEPGETQLRREQWMREGLLAQLRAVPCRSVRYGVTAHLLGRVLDQRFDGRSQILRRDAGEAEVVAEAGSDQAAEVLLHTVDL